MGKAGQAVEVGLAPTAHRYPSLFSQLNQLLQSLVERPVEHKQFEGLTATTQPFANRVEPV